MTQTGSDKEIEEDHNSKPHALTKNDLVGSHNLPDSLKALPGGKIFASTGPRIMLEIITARTAAVIIALTWTVFIICFSIDFYLTYKSFHSSNYVLTAFNCSTYNVSATEYLPEFSCGNGAEASWNATVRELSNVISFSMDVQQVNMSSLVANRTSNDFTFSYNLQVWTCYNEGGCGESFDNSGTYTQDGNVWQKVLDLQGETIQVDLSTAMVSDGEGDKKISLQLITNTFQNQESIPTNGLVKSYLIAVQYQSNPFNLFSSENPTTQVDTTYNFHVVRYPGNRVMAAINVILLVITVAVLGVYCYILYKNIGSLSNWKHSLSEQKWVIMYFFLVILFQNPVYCVIVWYTRQPPVTAAYATYLMNYIAQSGLFTLWLLFAHSYQRKVQRKTFFYGPKVFIGVVIFVFGVFILTYQFPSLALPRTDRSAVQAVENWTHRLKVSFVICTIIYLVCIMFWTVAWFTRLFLTGRMMNRLPYMSTRYMQLSFRFFSLQATLVTFYYIAQYCLVAYFISRDTTTGYATSLTVLADNINVLFRQQFQLFGKTFFLTTYAMILAFMFLPPNLLDSSGFYTTIAATYAISEDEHKEVVKGRRQALKNVKRNLINQMTRYDQLISAKEDVFCVDLALKLRNVAFQSYYDRVDGAQTASSFGKTQDIDTFGFELIEEFYDPTHEVYCIIAREKVGPTPTADGPPADATTANPNKTGRIVVSFRGTASKRQMEDNMNYAQRPVDFQNLDIPSLDHLDRLTVPQNDPADEIDLETVEDEDDAMILASTNAQTLQQRFLRSGTVTSTMSNPTAATMNRPYAATSDAALPPSSRPSFFRGPSLSLFGRHPTTAASVASTNASVNSVASQMTQDQERVAMQVLGIRARKVPHTHGGGQSMVRGVSSASDDYYDLESVQPPGDGSRRFPAPLSPQSSSASYRFDGNNNTTTTNSAKMTMSGTGLPPGGDDPARETIIERAGHMGGNFTNFLSDAVGATNQGIDMVVGATTGVVTTAARNTPGLKKFVTPNVHAGFWEAYTVVRGFVHGVLRAELMRRPTTVIFTGHSLGGALATFASLDFKITSLPRINAYLRHQAKKQLWRLQTMDLEQGSGGTAPGAYANPATATGAPSMYASLRQVLFPYLDTSGLDGDGDLDEDEDEHHGGPQSNATIKATKQQSFLKRFNPTKLFTTTGGGGGGAANAGAANASESMIGTSNVGIYRPPSVDSTGGNPTSPKHALIPASSPPNSPPTANAAAANSGGWGPFLSTQNSQALRSGQNADIAAGGVFGGAGSTQYQAVFVDKIDVVMYNFGSPRVGNFAFKQLFDKEVPRSYRVVVDGDVVPGLPPSGYGYVHIGTEILIDSVGVGTIIIDPSFVERWLRTHLKSSISVHSLLVYRKGLLGVKLSAEALRDYATSEKKEHVDPTRLALTWRNRVQIEKVVESETAEDHPKTPTPTATGNGGGDTSPTTDEGGAMGHMRRSSASAAALLASVGTMVQQTMRRGSHTTPTATATTAATTAATAGTVGAPSATGAEAAATMTDATAGGSGIRPFPLSLQSVSVQSMTGGVSPRPGSGEKKIVAREDDETHSPLLAHHQQSLGETDTDDYHEGDGHVESTRRSESIVLASGTEAERKHSEQSFTSDDGISLRPMASASTTTAEPLTTGGTADLHARVSESAVAAPAVVPAANADDDELAKKDTLRRMRMMEGSQEEDYYDHTERDYTDLMHQIRAARAANNPLNHIKRVNKLLPKFLKRHHHHHPTPTASGTTATAAAAHDGGSDYVPPPFTNAAAASAAADAKK